MWSIVIKHSDTCMLGSGKVNSPLMEVLMAPRIPSLACSVDSSLSTTPTYSSVIQEEWSSICPVRRL